ncbi:MAG TPA: murein biosynthesis integral membrane protein MurJ [Clostridiaceae bacterium]|nr:murein biosynthesis integral membrane protein MurJ [Clostridiaceae bacterium]
MTSMILSRITGFLRSTLITNLMLKSDSDALFAAFKTTDIMYNLLVGGSIAAALIPVLSGYIARNEEEEGWRVVGSFINSIFLIMLLISSLGIIFAPQVVNLTAPGYDEDVYEVTITLTKILFPSVSFIMLAGLTNGVLNSYQRFAAAAYGPTIYNLGTVFSIFALYRYGVDKVALGIMVSALIYFLFQLTFAYRHIAGNYSFKIYYKHSGYKRIIKLAIPSLLASSITQLNTVISQSYTSNFKQGSVTALNNANDIWQLPHGIFAMGMGMALLPTFSEKHALGERETFKTILNKSIKTVLFLTIPSGVGFIVLREPIISAIYKWSANLGTERIAETGKILMFYTLALFSQSILAIVNRAFYACNDTKTPLYSGILSIGTNVLFCYIFYRFTNLEASGMALAYSIACTVNALILLYILNRKLKGIHLKELINFIVKIIVSSFLMGVILFFVIKNVPIDFSRTFTIENKIQELWYLMLIITIGVVAYLIITIVLKVEEARYFIALIKSKFIKSEIRSDLTK